LPFLAQMLARMLARTPQGEAERIWSMFMHDQTGCSNGDDGCARALGELPLTLEALCCMAVGVASQWVCRSLRDRNQTASLDLHYYRSCRHVVAPRICRTRRSGRSDPARPGATTKAGESAKISGCPRRQRRPVWRYGRVRHDVQGDGFAAPNVALANLGVAQGWTLTCRESIRSGGIFTARRMYQS
jgi:hypothetical protein